MAASGAVIHTTSGPVQSGDMLVSSTHPKQLQHFINGEFLATQKTFRNISPVNGQVISDVCEADAATVDAAVKAAQAALKGPWGRMGVQERAAVLHKIADGIQARLKNSLRRKWPIPDARCIRRGRWM